MTHLQFRDELRAQLERAYLLPPPLQRACDLSHWANNSRAAPRARRRGLRRGREPDDKHLRGREAGRETKAREEKRLITSLRARYASSAGTSTASQPRLTPGITPRRS